MAAPLEGLLVVALEQALAAPLCTVRLADAGARVIKIERPEGDFARLYDDATAAGSSYFVWANRGKESIVLDLREGEARQVLSKLVARADILVQNLKPGAMDRLGFSIEELRRRHPALICCSISGYGDEGPLASRKAYDLLVQAESGLSSITGGPSEPSRVGISVVDIAVGVTAQAAILEALIVRGRTGAGADIRISMFDVMADWLTAPFLNAEAGKPPRRVGLAHPSIAPYGIFATADGRSLLISVQSEREWRAFCRDILDAPELADDPRFATNVARVKHRDDTDAAIGAKFAATPAAELMTQLGRADIAFAELNDMAALSRHPHLRRVQVETEAGPVSMPAPGVIVRGEPRTYGAVPAIGAHTAAVLAEFGSPGEFDG
jgi:formyl-CoA transferase